MISNVEDLIRAEPLSKVTTLVINTPAQPKGDLLVALGRMNVEYPDMQKFAVLAGPPPLRVAIFLSACGVQMTWPSAGEDKQEN